VNTPILMESGVRVSHGRIEAVRGTDLTVVPEFFWLPRRSPNSPSAI